MTGVCVKEGGSESVFVCVNINIGIMFYLRVRLVERGSPHSLPLMESGKVKHLHMLLTLHTGAVFYFTADNTTEIHITLLFCRFYLGYAS